MSELASERKKKNLDRVLKHVSTKGGRLENPIPVLTSDKVTVRCAMDHSWQVQVGSLIYQNSWCSRCKGNFKRTIEDLKQIVEKRGGTLLTLDYTGVDGSYDFLCNLGHANRNRFKKIEMGQWCPTCNKHSKSEEITRTILENLFGAKFPKRRPSWLRNSRGRQMELDGFAEGIGVAFEYQGAQHFLGSTLYKTDLDQRKKDDETKIQLCQENGIVLLVYSYLDKFEDFHDITNLQLQQAGRIIELDFAKDIDFQSAYIRDDRLEELRTLLEPKKIKVLSSKWTTVDHHYEFQCQVCKSTFKAKANSYFNSRRVAGCDYCNRQKPRNKLSLDDLVEYANKFEGKLVSNAYIRSNHVYKWICKFGHEFEAKHSVLNYHNQFCPTCEDRQIHQLLPKDEADKMFAKFGFTLIGGYPGRSRYAATICRKCGFEGGQTLDRLRSGKASCRGCVALTNESKSRKTLSEANLEPLVPFPGMYSPWPCICLVCQREVSPRMSNLRKGQTACKFCATKYEGGSSK